MILEANATECCGMRSYCCKYHIKILCFQFTQKIYDLYVFRKHKPLLVSCCFFERTASFSCSTRNHRNFTVIMKLKTCLHTITNQKGQCAYPLQVKRLKTMLIYGTFSKGHKIFIVEF